VNEVKSYLDDFGKYIVQQSRTNLTKKGKKDTNELYKSIGYDLQASKNSFHLSFKMVDYGKFVDLGVKGVSSSAKAPNSPFKFGTGTGMKGGLTNGIDGWVKRKRIQFKNRGNGKFLSYDQTAFLIRNSVWNKGIRPTDFFSRPFELAFKKLPDELTEAYALEVDKFLKDTLND
jgi:hypothetical protein